MRLLQGEDGGGNPWPKVGWALGGTAIMTAWIFVAGGYLGKGFTWMSPRKPQTETPQTGVSSTPEITLERFKL